LDTKRRTPFPPIPRKFLLQVARNHVVVQLLARKLDDRLLQCDLIVTPGEIHDDRLVELELLREIKDAGRLF
jgi:hypothetical protein